MRFNDQKKLYRQNALIQSDILNLPDSRGLDVTAVSGKCADIIRSIHGSMSRLAPMGDDERRSLWVEVKGKRWEWYRLSVSTYKDCHYLYITGATYDHHVFCDKEDCNSRHCFYEDELAGIFSKIEKYIAELVDNILSAPEQYNSYVEKYLSYYRREGLIKRSVLSSLIPDNSYDGIDIPRVINLYENQFVPTQFSEMTLRRYMHYWRIAYEAVYGKMSGDDIEVFRHSSKGYEAREYNLDSEDDFRRWKSDVSPYHGFDVVYARVHLYPTYTNDQWHFYVSTGSYWNLDDCFRAVVGLSDAGISVELGEVNHILGILKETDYVEITPYAYRYMQGDDIGSQMKLPYADEVGKDVIKEIIANTKWNKILNRLNGRIYLVLGNHDLKNIWQGFIDRFEHVAMSMCIQVGKKKIYLNHFPYRCFEGGYHNDVWQLFGHVHTRPSNTGIDAGRLQNLFPTQLDVGVDNNNFMPLSFDEVRAKIQRQIESN